MLTEHISIDWYILIYKELSTITEKNKMTKNENKSHA